MDSGSQIEKTETSGDRQREPATGTQTDNGPPKVGSISVGRTQSEQQTTEGVVANRAGQVLLAHTLLKSGTSFGSLKSEVVGSRRKSSEVVGSRSRVVSLARPPVLSLVRSLTSPLLRPFVQITFRDVRT